MSKKLVVEKTKLIIDADEKIICKGFEQPLTEEERATLIRAIGNGKPYNPSDDAISREALLADFKERNIWSKDIVEAINNASPVEPAKPKGEWQYATHYARRYRVCPFCKSEKEDDRSAGWFYCWHCGAKMKDGKEE